MRRKIHELAALATDCYKFSHKSLYPQGTEEVYSNMTPRRNSYFPWSDKYVSVGSEMFVGRFLIDYWNKNFFELAKEEVVSDFELMLNAGGLQDTITKEDIADLHDLGYLPIELKALPEGLSVPVGIPMITVKNTDAKYFWLVNFIETALLSEIYPVMNAATIAREYKKAAIKWAEITCDDEVKEDHIPWQFHDFSRRGHHGNDAGTTIALGHLTSFSGTDSIQGAVMAANYYGADLEDLSSPVFGSVMATEHSVASAYGRMGELDYYEQLIDRHPDGILSMVSDTYDYWNVISNLLPSLKDKIMKRNGKIVVRPDSGDIIEVIAGKSICHVDIFESFEEALSENNNQIIQALYDFVRYSEVVFTKDSIIEYQGIYYKIDEYKYDHEEDYVSHVKISEYELTAEDRGTLDVLWEHFGGTVNSKGYKLLDPHIGLIYGDSVTLNNVNEIFQAMERKGFASSNIVLGIGAYSYSVMNTRDTMACAFKTTAVVVNGEERHVQKDPATDKKKTSAKGYLAVVTEQDVTKDNYGDLVLIQDMKRGETHPHDNLEIIYQDGRVLRHTSLNEIRTRINYTAHIEQ
ncbi:nicotinate phosphoribosyltransferase [Enterococcus mundtii]|uniref:nicotinate phosphoribosyltransferase n=1 Tax=Enterococcus mundtii TaxID=53346 RepID=UPI001A9623CD|nr:nicotinate phosphoribosyltransferase [Enterococcus mundtii]MBO1087159.1 nicotinate phosphoribosyltransferase [Enterococcus mundtii]